VVYLEDEMAVSEHRSPGPNRSAPRCAGAAVKSSTLVLSTLDWLWSTEIQEARPGEENFGSVRQGYDAETKSYPFIYSEITGYAASLWVNAYQWTQEPKYLQQAAAAAAFVSRLQRRQGEPGQGLLGAVAHGLTLPGNELRPAYYSFDNAMILQGLLDLYRVQPDPNWLDTARAIGDWLVDWMQLADGSFQAVRLDGDRFTLPPTAAAFGDGGCLHAKHAIGLLKLTLACGDEKYARSAERVCDWVLSIQDPDGAIQSNSSREKVVTHTHCYATEGLLAAAHTTGSLAYQTAAEKAGYWLLNSQNPDGSISIDYKQQWWKMGRRIIEKWRPKKVSDATAQSIRIWMILYRQNADERLLNASRKAANFLNSLQARASGDANADGGFYYWRGRHMLFAWSAMFAAQAAHWLDQVQESSPSNWIEELF
jgi:rhamnogalacturonyl hydrolase YesR